MITLYDYLCSLGYGQGVRSHSGEDVICCCPLHPEHVPSFKIYNNGGTDEHWFCFHGSGDHGDIIKMINLLEMGNQDRPEIWRDCYTRYAELSGTGQPSLLKTIPFLRPEPPQATPVQRVMLTVAMHWWHTQLWQETGERGQRYFHRRGVALGNLRFCVQLGYAPSLYGQQGAQQDLAFRSVLAASVEGDWQEIAKSVGLLSQETGNVVHRDRIMFCSINGQGECVYFQGRQVQMAEEEKKKFPYLGASVRKVPFVIPLPGVHLFVTHLESPVGTASLAADHLLGFGWMGSPMPSAMGDPFLRAMMGNRLQMIVMDTDRPHTNRQGKIYYPGDLHAEKLQMLCREASLHSERLSPPVACKGFDEWKLAWGVETYLQAVQEVLVRCA